MPTLPEQFDYAGIHCYRSPDDPNTLLYIPGAPVPQLTTADAPMISLMTFAPFAFLQMSVQWQVLDEELDALRAALAQQDPQLDLAAVRLAHAPVSVERVVLELTAADGSVAQLASTVSSGMPPFTAIFNVQLTEPQQAAVVSALNGQAGVLAVRYHATLPVPERAEVTLIGDLTSELAAARGMTDRREALNLIGAAIEQGHLAVSRAGTAGDAARWAGLLAQARQQAADQLLRMASTAPAPADVVHFRVSAADTLLVAQPIERATDISSWFGARGGLDHFQVVG